MGLERQKHDNNAAIEAEFNNIDRSKEPAFVWNATRAPNTSDAGRVWIHKNGAQLDLYLYDSVAGAWRGPQSFT